METANALDIRLSEFVDKNEVAVALAANSELVQLLPSDIVPSTPDAENLSTALASSQFKDAISSLDGALKNGGLTPGFIRDAGMPEGTGSDYTSFLTALVDLKPSTGGDAMETD
jgi:hypothetical protein